MRTGNGTAIVKLRVVVTHKLLNSIDNLRDSFTSENANA